MDTSRKAFFNVKQDLYHGSQPNFYKCSDLEWTPILELNYLRIKQEFDSVLATQNDLLFKKKSLHRAAGWKQIELKIYGVPNTRLIGLFPETMEILNQIKGVSTIYFSMLKAGSIVSGHVGDTDAFYRVHLGLDIPDSLPLCGIQVAGEKRNWETGKCLVFNDVYFHEAWNFSEKDRLVLIIDVMHETFLKNQNYINAGVRATLYFSRIYKLSLYTIELLPRILQRLIHPFLHAVLYLIHSIRFKQNETDVQARSRE